MKLRRWRRNLQKKSPNLRMQVRSRRRIMKNLKTLQSKHLKMRTNLSLKKMRNRGMRRSKALLATLLSSNPKPFNINENILQTSGIVIDCTSVQRNIVGDT